MHKRVVGRDAEPDRRVDLGQLADDESVLDVAHAGSAVLLGHEDAQKAELAGLLEELDGEALGLVDLVDDRVDLLAARTRARRPGRPADPRSGRS